MIYMIQFDGVREFNNQVRVVPYFYTITYILSSWKLPLCPPVSISNLICILILEYSVLRFPLVLTDINNIVVDRFGSMDFPKMKWIANVIWLYGWILFICLNGHSQFTTGRTYDIHYILNLHITNSLK